MKTIKLVLFFSFLFSYTITIKSQVTIDADDPLIYYVGRINYTDVKAPVFSYSGVTIKAKFEGTQVSAILNSSSSNNYLFVIVDDSIPFKINVSNTETTVLLADNMSDTEHTVELFKLTEANQGTVTFSGFVLDNAKSLVALPTPSPRKIEYIGNSITCGYGNEILTPASGFSPDEENHYYTYAAYTSRSIDAQHMAVCYSGKGVYRNNSGPVGGSTDDMPSIYDRISPGDVTTWNFSTYQPDVVCINLGTNDLSGTSTDYDTSLYHSEYVGFINTVRANYPSAKIVLLAGSMMSGEKLDIQKNILNTIVAEFAAGGDNEVYFFEMSYQTGEFGYGGHYHPTVAQHKHNGAELTQYLSALMGWTIHPDFMRASVITSGHKVQIDCNVKMKSPSADLSSFDLKVNDVSATILSAHLSADSLSIIITIESRIVEGDEVIVTYADGGVVSVDDNALRNIYEFPVANDLVMTSLLIATVNSEGNEIEMIFDKDMLLPTTMDDILISTSISSNISIDSVYFDPVHGAQMLHAVLSGIILKNETVTISYSAASIVGNDSVPLNSFSNVQVENNSTSDGTSIKTSFPSAEVFPNPSSTCFKLVLNSTSICNYALYNMAGQKIVQEEINQDISFGSDLPAGTYILIVQNGQKEKMIKLFKK